MKLELQELDLGEERERTSPPLGCLNCDHVQLNGGYIEVGGWCRENGIPKNIKNLALTKILNN